MGSGQHSYINKMPILVSVSVRDKEKKRKVLRNHHCTSAPRRLHTPHFSSGQDSPLTEQVFRRQDDGALMLPDKSIGVMFK